jgi:hypothetical protein
MELLTWKARRAGQSIAPLMHQPRLLALSWCAISDRTLEGTCGVAWQVHGKSADQISHPI